MGHGPCDLFNKQTLLVGPGGRPTSDVQIIGDHAWRYLKEEDFVSSQRDPVGDAWWDAFRGVKDGMDAINAITQGGSEGTIFEMVTINNRVLIGDSDE